MWATLIPIIAQYGLPFAEALFQKWTSGATPTQADFDQLRAMINTNATAIMTAQLKAAGIDPTSAQGLAMLALVK